jgi:SET domain-containing protein
VLPIEGERYTLQQAEELEESGDVRANYMVFVQVGRKQFGVCLHGHTVGYVNHSRHQRNTKLVWDKRADEGHLVAVRDIGAGEEILFDYGDRRRDVVTDNPWLRQ